MQIICVSWKYYKRALIVIGEAGGAAAEEWRKVARLAEFAAGGRYERYVARTSTHSAPTRTRRRWHDITYCTRSYSHTPPLRDRKWGR